MQHGGVKERFQYAACAAGRGDDVDLVSLAGIGPEGDVSGIGKYFACFGVGDEGGQVMDIIGTVVACIPVDDRLCLPLQHLADGGRDTRSRSVGCQPFEQVGRFVG